MDNSGFVTPIYSSAIKFWELSKSAIEWYRDLLGTNVIVTRVTEKDKRKAILSATLTSTFEDNSTIEKFNWKLLINMSTMLPLWKRNQSVDVVDTVDKLQIGDLVRFEYLGVQYQFKVQSAQSYGVGHEICWQYSLIPIIEHKI